MAMTDKKKKLMVTAIAGAMAATLAVGGGTFAYLQGTTDNVKNEFETEQVTVEISESPHDPYKIIPGTEQGKDPTVTVKNTVESFVFLNVKNNTYDLVDYEIDGEIWTELSGYDGIYYTKVPAATDEDGNKLNVLKDKKVSYDKNLLNENMLDGNNLRTDVALTFSAFAIQARPFLGDITNTESQAAVYAYTQTEPIKAASIADIKNAISSASNGETVNIILTEDIAITDDWVKTQGTGINLIIDGNGHTITGDGSGTAIFYTDSIKMTNVTLDVGDGKKAVWSNSGSASLTNVTVKSHASGYDEPWPILFYGGGPATLTNCTVHGKYKPVSDGGRYSFADVWAGDGRELTVNGGSYGSIFVNASNGAGHLSAGTIIVNDGTIDQLMLETEKNKNKEGEYEPKTAYMSAQLIKNGGTITNLIENPQNYDLNTLTKLN